MAQLCFVNFRVEHSCICCLAKKSKLTKLSSCRHAGILEILTDVKLEFEDSYICYICHHMLDKFSAFKKQVQDNMLEQKNIAHWSSSRSKYTCSEVELCNYQGIVSRKHDLEYVTTEDSREPIQLNSPVETDFDLEIDVNKINGRKTRSEDDGEGDAVAMDIEIKEEADDSSTDCEMELSVQKDVAGCSGVAATRRADNTSKNVETGTTKVYQHKAKSETKTALEKIKRNGKQSAATTAQPTDTETVYITESSNDMDNIPLVPNNQENENPTNKTLNDKLDMIFSALSFVQENQKTMQQAMERTLRTISNSNLKTDEFSKGSQPVHKSTSFRMEPIESKESLIEFEEKLKDPAQVVELKEKFERICGSGKGRGLNNCYSLVDAMFTRRFLTQCSWSGGSRNESFKICFKAYENVFNFFYSVIHVSDPTFTITECRVFFKNILRNSLRRYAAKGLRKSAPKKRTKTKCDGKKSAA